MYLLNHIYLFKNRVHKLIFKLMSLLLAVESSFCLWALLLQLSPFTHIPHSGEDLVLSTKPNAQNQQVNTHQKRVTIKVQNESVNYTNHWDFFTTLLCFNIVDFPRSGAESSRVCRGLCGVFVHNRAWSNSIYLFVVKQDRISRSTLKASPRKDAAERCAATRGNLIMLLSFRRFQLSLYRI